MSILPPPIPAEEPGCPTPMAPPVTQACATPGPQTAAESLPSVDGDAVMPPTYFMWLLVCILLCVVTAVIGLVFSSKVSQRWRMGDVEGARRASADARLMLLASVVLGLINVPFMMLYFALT